MKTWAVLCTCALVLGLAVAVLANDEGDAYDAMFMKPAIAANLALQKDVMGGDMTATAKDAADLQSAFAKVEGFWSQKGADDAVGFAKGVEKAAGDVKDAAGKGDKDAAAAAAKGIAASCGGCHMAHRARAANGWDLH